MNYNEARPLIQSGDLLAWSHYSWATWYDLQVQAVRIATESEYCHVGLALAFAGRVWVVESVQPTVRLMPLSNLLDGGAFWLPLNAPMSDAETEFALAKVGKGKYSKLQAIQAQLNAIEVGADDLWSCAEFLIAARRLSGVDLGPKATPAAVVRAAQARLRAPLHFLTGDSAK